MSSGKQVKEAVLGPNSPAMTSASVPSYLLPRFNPAGIRFSQHEDNFFFHFFVSLLRCFLRLLVLEGKVESAGLWGQYRFDAEAFLCNCAQKDTGNFGKTPGGMLWFLPWANLRYVGASSLAAVSYASYLTANKATIQCPGCSVSASDLYALGRSQLPDRL